MTTTLQLWNALTAPAQVLAMKVLDYRGSQSERLILEQDLYNSLKDCEFVDIEKLMSNTVCTEADMEYFKSNMLKEVS